MDLVALEKRYRGARFGELVLEHHKKLDLPTLASAFQETQAELPPAARVLVESWLDEIGANGRHEDFWRSDCAKVLTDIVGAAHTKLRSVGISPSSEDVFNMFQLAVLNFAYSAHKHPQSKAFIQKALGVGFLRRVLG